VIGRDQENAPARVEVRGAPGRAGRNAPTGRASPCARYLGSLIGTLERRALETEGKSREEMIDYYLARGIYEVEVLTQVDTLMRCRDKVLARRVARRGVRPTVECVANLTEDELWKYAHANSYDLWAHLWVHRRALHEAAAAARAACGKVVDLECAPIVEVVRLRLWAQGLYEEREQDSLEAGILGPWSKDA
jgi:hypothetical protein